MGSCLPLSPLAILSSVEAKILTFLLSEDGSCLFALKWLVDIDRRFIVLELFSCPNAVDLEGTGSVDAPATSRTLMADRRSGVTCIDASDDAEICVPREPVKLATLVPAQDMQIIKLD